MAADVLNCESSGHSRGARKRRVQRFGRYCERPDRENDHSPIQVHAMTRLVNAILQAQGYKTYMSPKGPTKGIDILAAPPPMRFGAPKICVQVKSSETLLDPPTLDQVIGAMQNVHAQNGLLVSCGGFKASIDKEKATKFFQGPTLDVRVAPDAATHSASARIYRQAHLVASDASHGGPLACG
jgi:hypothetical protein